MDGLAEVGVDLGLLVGALLGVGRAGREDTHNLEEESIDGGGDFTNSAGNPEFGLLVEDDQDGGGVGHGIRELEKTLNQLIGESVPPEGNTTASDEQRRTRLGREELA